MQSRTRALLLVAVLAAVAAPSLAYAQSEAAPIPQGVRVPAWKQLSPAQRRDLARLADRWDTMPASRRVAILERWQRWQSIPPEQRETLRRGERNFQSMPAPLRAQMRRSLAAVAELPPAEQRRLRATWRSLSPELRREWLERGGPGFAPPPR
jgi:hypothetical protein